MEAQMRFRKDMASCVFGGKKAKPKPKKVVKPPTPENAPPDAADESKSEKKNAPRVNFVRRNIDDAAYSRNRQKVVPAVSRKEAVLRAVHEPGEIPSAISQRKKDLIASKLPPKESDCPPGMRLLSEDEKVESLDALSHRKEEIEETLGHAPLRIESQTLIRQHRELEQELQDIDRSMDQLKRRYVFVPE
jgi:hypothetical protein